MHVFKLHMKSHIVHVLLGLVFEVGCTTFEASPPVLPADRKHWVPFVLCGNGRGVLAVRIDFMVP